VELSGAFLVVTKVAGCSQLLVRYSQRPVGSPPRPTARVIKMVARAEEAAGIQASCRLARNR
jgi:hypothetical protein